MFCASSIGASVASASACVSPRWKMAEPCARGSTPTSQVIWTQILVAAPVHSLLLFQNADAEGLFLDVIERLRDRERRPPPGIFRGPPPSLLRAAHRPLSQRATLPCGIKRAFDPIARHLIRNLEQLRLHAQAAASRVSVFRLAPPVPFACESSRARAHARTRAPSRTPLPATALARAFDHDDVVFGADVNQIEIALHALGVRRIGNELAVDPADADRADWSVERNVGNAQRGRTRR